MARRPLFASQTTAFVVGAVLFTAGTWCLWDAWPGRGQKAPWIVNKLAPW